MNENPITLSDTKANSDLENSICFLKLASRGKNTWWRYIVSIFLIFFTWQIIGSIPYVVIMLMDYARFPLIAYLALSFSFICLISATILAVRIIHQRNPLTLITSEKSLSVRKILISAGAWFLIILIISLFDAVLHPGSYKFTFEWKSFFLFLPLAIILTPIQTSAEELLFRGYFLQGLNFLTGNKWILSTISGILFAIPHFLNPEMEHGFILLALFYFAFGWFLTMITLQSNRLEYALGIHAANNLTTVLLANYVGSALPSPSIFTANIIDPAFNLISFILGACLLWIFLFKLLPEKYRN